MIDVKFDITVNGGVQDEPLLNDYEMTMMLDHTKAQLKKHVQQSLGGLRCGEHNQPPIVHITGAYSLETEQIDVSYHMDTCCKPFLLQAVKALNR